MNTLVVLSIVIAAAMAKPTGQLVAVSQDTLGNYNLKYAVDGISRVESRNLHGSVDGAYSYIDPHGILRELSFTSGVHGFNAVGTDIPQPVQDTPEVAHAKAEHLAVLHAAYLNAPRHPEFFGVPETHLFRSAHLGGPVYSTPFVHGLPEGHLGGHIGLGHDGSYSFLH